MGSDAEYQRTDEDVLRDLPFKLAPRVTKAGACRFGGLTIAVFNLSVGVAWLACLLAWQLTH